MRFVGCGDALGSGGRYNTCFHVTGARVIAEAYTYARIVKNHLSLVTLEAHLPEIHPKRLVLTHMSDDMLGRLDTLGYAAASDGMIVEL